MADLIIRGGTLATSDVANQMPVAAALSAGMRFLEGLERDLG